jgi:hypothetical protein
MLAGSTSLTSTVTSQLKLRIVAFLRALLVVIWALSPVGGQASFRQITVGSQTQALAGSFAYMKFSGDLEPYDGSDREAVYSIMNSLFVSSILAPPSRKAATVDIRNNVKIPMIEAYQNNSSPDDQGWFNTPQNHNVYSPLIGIPMAGIEDSAVYNIKSVETQYMNLECPVVNELNNRKVYPDYAALGTGCCMWSTDNMTTRDDAGRSLKNPRSFIYESFGGPGMSICNIRTTWVEVDISCGTTEPCAASKIRRSRQDHPSPAFTLIDSNPQGWTMFSTAFATSVAAQFQYGTPVQTYLMDPNDPTGHILSPMANNKLSLPTKGEYEVRLGQLMNSYWIVMKAFSCSHWCYDPGNGMDERHRSEQCVLSRQLLDGPRYKKQRCSDHRMSHTMVHNAVYLTARHGRRELSPPGVSILPHDNARLNAQHF